ncbi:MAG: uroporphyrinogen decarboxylase family protein [Campylobacterota bacterium]|nr:uroporphyrinogen decarboxylase family protein [Campylobacterota bacterium]
MNSIERVVDTVNFKKTDRVPVIAQIGGHSAILSGYRLIDYVKSGVVAAKSQINALKYYGYDAVFAIFDTCVETEAAGSTIRYREDIYPSVIEYALNESTDFDNLKVPDPYKDGRMPEILKCVNILRREVGDETVVIGTVIGPMTIATQLVGIEKALYMAIDFPDRFEKLLEYATKIAISFSIAQLKEGAHTIVVFDPSASGTLIPPQFYREFVLPKHKELFAELGKNGSAANWIHSAGKITDILKYYKEAGINLVNFDWEMEPDIVKDGLPGICIDGNIKPLDFVNSTPQNIFDESKRLLNIFKERGGFILSSGCEIPPEAKPENIKAMVDAVREP